MLAVWTRLGYTKLMQYKIPLQIENEDVIVAGLSLRQLVILMVWWGLGYTFFKYGETRMGPAFSAIPAVILVLIGVVMALWKVAEMTFLPTILSFFRLSLNAKSRMWSQGTDGYSDLDIGYSLSLTEKAPAEANRSLATAMGENTEINENILKL